MRRLGVIALTTTLISCAPTGEIHRKFDADSTSLSIDARQRLVLSVDRDGKRIICAEPSPDMFAVLAASGSLSGNANATIDAPSRRGRRGPGIAGADPVRYNFDGAAGIETSRSSTETGTQFTNRSQTIQLLRDGMYRACEAYMNGAIGQAEYRTILSKQDDMLLNLIAVEHLGNAEKGDEIYKIVHDYMCLQLAEKPYGNRTVVSEICSKE